MRSPSDLREVEREFCSQGDTAGRRAEKIVVVRASGCFVETDDGRRLLDMQMFNSSANFGYGSPAHEQALKDQLTALPGVGSEYQSAARIELAAEIAISVLDRFGRKGRVHFSVSGAQAVDDALRLVAVATGRRSVFAFQGGYHGRTIAASGISASYRYRHGFGPHDRAHFVPFPYCFRCPYGKDYPSCGHYCVSQFERLFESEAEGVRDAAGNVEFAAFVAEPVLGRGGYIPPPPEYLPRLKAVLDRYGVLLVCDDIQMGLFRTGRLWTLERFEVEPDILLFGKAITNGLFPVSGFWARDPLAEPDRWVPGSSHTTFAGRPIGMATGLATFRLLRSTDFESRAEALGEALETGLRNLAERHPEIARIDRLGLALSVEFCVPGTREAWPARTAGLREAALRATCGPSGSTDRVGLLLAIGGYRDNIITLSPSLTMTDEEVRLFLDLFERYLEVSRDPD